MGNLDAVGNKIADTFGIRRDKFARQLARLSGSAGTYGLTEDELKIARAAGVSPRAFARELRAQGGRSSAIAAAGGREDKPGLLYAHSEVDRAHKAEYDAGWHVSAENTSDRELLDAALSALKKYDPDKDDDDSYELLLNGAVYVMRLLNRMAPEYAEIKEKK